MVYVFLADGFEEIEALTPVDCLRRCGAEVATVSISQGTEVLGARGIIVRADTTLEELTASGLSEKPEALVLPGGMPGTKNLAACDGLRSLLLRYADDDEVLIAAICAAPSVLGELGLLRGRRAVCYPGYEKALEGAYPATDRVIRDGNRITAVAAGAAEEFALALASALRGGEAAGQLRSSMLMR